MKITKKSQKHLGLSLDSTDKPTMTAMRQLVRQLKAEAKRRKMVIIGRPDNVKIPGTSQFIIDGVRVVHQYGVFIPTRWGWTDGWIMRADVIVSKPKRVK